MRRENTVVKSGKHVVSLGGDERALSLGDNGGPSFDPLEPLLTVNEAAAILRCSTHSLNRWRLTGDGPKFIYVGRRVRYRRADLAAFIAASTRNSTSDPGEPTAATAERKPGRRLADDRGKVGSEKAQPKYPSPESASRRRPIRDRNRRCFLHRQSSPSRCTATASTPRATSCMLRHYVIIAAIRAAA